MCIYGFVLSCIGVGNGTVAHNFSLVTDPIKLFFCCCGILSRGGCY